MHQGSVYHQENMLHFFAKQFHPDKWLDILPYAENKEHLNGALKYLATGLVYV